MAQGNGIFRQETIDRLSSPDDLTDYLKVTNPGMWGVLVAVVVLLVGLIVWSSVGTLPTTVSARAYVQDGSATIRIPDSSAIAEGMPVTIDGPDGALELSIERVAEDADGEAIGLTSVSLPDGAYEADVVVDETRAIDFLLKSD